MAARTGDDGDRADLAHILARLLANDLTTGDPAADTALAAAGEQVRTRLAEAVPELDGSAATEQALAAVLATDPALAGDIADLVDKITHAGAPARTAVLARRHSTSSASIAPPTRCRPLSRSCTTRPRTPSRCTCPPSPCAGSPAG